MISNNSKVTEPKDGVVTAIGMLSGGLDSTLATQLMLNQGIKVLGLNFYTGFCVTEQQRRVGRIKPGGKAPRNEALKVGSELRVPIEIVDIAQEYKSVVLNPKHGYGANMNPCVDCRAMMISRAGNYMKEKGAQFVFTGEVLGQRPKSQHRPQLDIVAREAGLEGYLLRPLSARLLGKTVPETRGWVDRNKLEAISGRSRKRQMELADEFGITDYAQPAGGCCYLADPNYSRKFRDLLNHREEQNYEPEDAVLLGLGRHFRIAPTVKAVVGRDENENEVISRMKDGRAALMVQGIPGPLCLVDGIPNREELSRIASLTARYSDCEDDQVVRVAWTQGDKTETLLVKPMQDREIEALRI